ncbi:hypothetical protein [Gardnerella sp. Marseille-Q2328]|uniref:hypothetical protein n=1 Tax=Gardnerella sp. Marseille-Q2328 TaxID=2759694 RepID=UPI0020252A59|nr:hypothetical protein [Gardnerella sp. Marseille-Q2328]
MFQKMPNAATKAGEKSPANVPKNHQNSYKNREKCALKHVVAQLRTYFPEIA